MDIDVGNADYELDINPETLCCICLNQDQPLRSIFYREIMDGKIVNLPTAIENVLDIRIDQEAKFPDKICIVCRKKVQDFFVFKEKAKNNHILLKKLFSQEAHENGKEDQTGKEIEKHEGEVEEEVQDIECLAECSECGIVFANDEEYSEHKMTCVVFIQCYYCSDIFPDEAEVKQHIEEVHREELPEDADVEVIKIQEEQDVKGIENEEEELTELTQLAENQKMISSNQKWDCSLCLQKFTDSDQFKSHESFHRNSFPQIISNIIMYKCASCCTVFLDINQLQDHMEVNDCLKNQIVFENILFTDTKYLNQNDEEGLEGGFLKKIFSVEMQVDSSLKCEYCESSFLDLSSALQHWKDEHDESAENDEKFHQCGICLDFFHNQRSVRQHLYLDHCKSFDCCISNCDKSYQTSSKLFQHQLRCHSQNHEHHCSHCYEIIPSNSSLTHHLRNECSARKHKCSICPKMFITQMGKKQHEMIHQELKKHKCDQCDKSFISRIELIIHNRLHTGEKPYSCSQCPKKFRTLSNKKDHMSTHIVEKNYMCSVCKMFFKSERTLRGHMMIHRDNKIHQCRNCGKCFRRKQHLNSHMKLHLKNEEINS